jgi:polyisoprenoid-binding protein YceI
MKFLSLLLLSLSLAQAADIYVIDPAASKLSFNGSSTLHDFAGTAKIASGMVILNGPTSLGVIEADATSMNTDSSGRDSKMHDEIMATKTWSTVRFEVNGFTSNATGGVATGWWTMHGVTRAISIPITLTPGSAGTPTHATSVFVVDIREWDIPVPRAALIITVDPNITVHVDLSMAPAPSTAVLPKALTRSLTGVTVTTAARVPVDVAKVSLGRPLIIFDEDGVSDAKKWMTLLGAKLPAGRTPLAILTAAGLSEKSLAKALKSGPADALVDATGSLRTSLQLPKREALVLTVNAAGMIGDAYTGSVNDAGRDTILKSLVVAVPGKAAP